MQQILMHVKGVTLVVIRGQLVVWMLGNIVLARKERPDAGRFLSGVAKEERACGERRKTGKCAGKRAERTAAESEVRDEEAKVPEKKEAAEKSGTAEMDGPRQRVLLPVPPAEISPGTLPRFAAGGRRCENDGHPNHHH